MSARPRYNGLYAMFVLERAMDAATGPDVFDLTIIGGGPVGLFAAYYAGMRHMRAKILDSLPELGGQLTALYPEKYIFDVAGFPRVLAKDLAERLIEQAMQYSPALALGETVQTLETLPHEAVGGHGPLYRITTDQAEHVTRTLLICAGAGAFSPKKLAAPGAAELEGRGIHYAVRSKAEFAGKDVVIIGGGNSAVDWALNLHEAARSLTLVHRRNVFRAHEDSVRKLQATKAKILTFFEVESFITEGGALKDVVLVNNQSHEQRTLPSQALLAQIGFNSSLGPIKNWPLEFERGSIRVNTQMETKLPGVFAAGDVAMFDGKLKLIAVGFGEAAIAVNQAKTRIDPKAKLFPGHSSEMVAQHGTEV